MKHRTLLLALGTLLALPAVAAPKPTPPSAAWQAAWQAANQPYKRALYATNQRDAGTARRNLAPLQAAWGKFRTAYQRKPPLPFRKDRAWSTDLAAISGWIETARRDVEAGRAPEAHDTLEMVRIRWMEMRSRAGIPTFGDHLTRFHGPMEVVVLTVKGKTPETLADSDMARLRKALPDLTTVWAAVRNDAARGSGAQASARRAMTEKVWRIITELEAALKAGDRAAVLSAGSALRPAYAPLYLQFG
jgi:hypothetical protein